MKILITGATGFVGGHFLRYFASIYGAENVHGTGRSKAKVEILKAEGFTLLCGDLLDLNFVSSELTSYDVYVHCAAKSSIWGTYDSFHSANVLATQNLLASVPANSQFIYLSSANMYFKYSDRISIREDDELCLTSFYSKTKRDAELLVLNLPNISSTVLRARAIVGIGDTVVFPRVIRAYKEGRLRIIGSGNNTIDFTSINNLCLAVYLSIKNRASASGQVYNISNGDTIVLWEEIKNILVKLGYTPKLKTVPYPLAYLVARFKELKTSLKDNEPAMTCYGVAVLNYSMSLDISKAKTELGYKPVENSSQTLTDFIRSVRMNPKELEINTHNQVPRLYKKA
mgnify:CR=1 FL=1